MATEISTDRSKKVRWYARQGDNQPITIRFTSGDPDRTWKFIISNFGGPVIYTLEDGDGITNNGDEIIIALPLDTDYLRTEQYKIALVGTDDDGPKTFINGDLVINDSYWEGDVTEEATIEVDTGDVIVEMDITIAGGDGRNSFRGLVSIASNLFPEVGGTNDQADGRPLPGDWYIATTAGTLKDRAEASLEVPQYATLYYTGAEDGNMQLGANWKVNQG